ncbi:hypothetical protein TNCV_71451 [Trichonephila clavipes]|nr:hypothetical protein TNCV_71451 [Trichonephila clavipes]
MRVIFLTRYDPIRGDHSALFDASEQFNNFGTFPNDWLGQSEASFFQHENFSQSLHTYVSDMGWMAASGQYIPVIPP